MSPMEFIQYLRREAVRIQDHMRTSGYLMCDQERLQAWGEIQTYVDAYLDQEKLCG